MARALAARPKLVCMDEPAAGLDTAESQALGARLRHIIDAGITIFLVDHDMGLVLNVCDYIYVIEFGLLIAEGTPNEIRSDARVIEAYLGESASEGGRRLMTALLEVEEMSTGYDGVPVVRDLNLHVDEGEVVALLGPNGAGKTTTLLTTSALVPDPGRRHQGASAGRSRVGGPTSSPATAWPTCPRTARCSSS